MRILFSFLVLLALSRFDGNCVLVVDDLRKLHSKYNVITIKNNCDNRIYCKIKLDVYKKESSSWECVLENASYRVQAPDMTDYPYDPIQANDSKLFDLYIPDKFIKKYNKDSFRIRVVGINGLNQSEQVYFTSKNFIIDASKK